MGLVSRLMQGWSSRPRPGRVYPESPVNGEIVEPEAKVLMSEDLSGLSIKGELQEMTDKEQQGQHLRIVSPVSPARLHCCYAVIIVLTGAVIALSVALSLSVRKEERAIAFPEAGNGTCPRNWIGFGSKCFYFSEHTSNWTSSQTSCMELGAHLTHFDSLEELNFLQRYKGDSTAWIGLHRESSEQPWMWTDTTEYNNLILIRGEGEHAYLSDRGISSGRNNIRRNWICSKPNSYALQCPEVSQLMKDSKEEVPH
ncbi:C-type lectin domain family 2 member E-like isoform X2 [Alexandromys fortis]|uniref:C-type lectin domain family 2 member E-like isoform X2 n=1 Tax=Alexandromys fortis TaxID=100897 RepID=UPI00215299E1|nr:C-type lectin domain family 2 member E-like isoform X2 [Microtus fortis]